MSAAPDRCNARAEQPDAHIYYLPGVYCRLAPRHDGPHDDGQGHAWSVAEAAAGWSE